jgi:hypothetical protein
MLLISFIIVFVAFGCDSGRTKIVDYYSVYDYADFDCEGNHVKAENVLMCKLASKNDPFIENVEYLQWNDSAIIASTDNGYFVIEASSYGLCCSCNSKTIGPLTENQLEDYIDRTGFVPDNREKIK